MIFSKSFLSFLFLQILLGRGSIPITHLCSHRMGISWGTWEAAGHPLAMQRRCSLHCSMATNLPGVHWKQQSGPWGLANRCDRCVWILGSQTGHGSILSLAAFLTEQAEVKHRSGNEGRLYVKLQRLQFLVAKARLRKCESNDFKNWKCRKCSVQSPRTALVQNSAEGAWAGIGRVSTCPHCQVHQVRNQYQCQTVLWAADSYSGSIWVGAELHHSALSPYLWKTGGSKG